MECDYGVREGDPSKIRRKVQFWIDPAKNVTVVRSEASLMLPGSSRWVAYNKSSSEDLVEVDGFWLPGTYRTELVEVPDQGSPYLMYSKVATITNWSVNPDLPDSRFRIAFEPGTTVNDAERGTTYTVGVINDAKVAEQSRAAVGLQAQYAEARSAIVPDADAPGWGRWVAAGAALVVLLSAAAWRLRGRSAGNRIAGGNS